MWKPRFSESEAAEGVAPHRGTSGWKKGGKRGGGRGVRWKARRGGGEAPFSRVSVDDIYEKVTKIRATSLMVG